MIRIDNQYTGDYWILEETAPPPNQRFRCQKYMSAGHHTGTFKEMELEAIKSAIASEVNKCRQQYTREQEALKEIQECLNFPQ